MRTLSDRMSQERGDDGGGTERSFSSRSDEDYLGFEPGRTLSGESDLGLATRYVGRVVHYTRSVGSTNEALSALAAEGAPAGTAYLADEQTCGRGRLGRPWFSPAGGGIWVSVLLRSGASVEKLAPLGIAAAVSVSDALRDATGLDVRVKWPNDILLNSRKLGGILVESVQTAGAPVDCAALGLGLNVNIAESEFPPELSATATSLSAGLGRPVRRIEVLRTVLVALETCFDTFQAAGFDAFRSGWRELSTLRGRRVRLDSGERGGEGSDADDWKPDLLGTVADIVPTGALLIATDDGRVREIWHGDVTPVPLDERGTHDD